MNRPSKTDFLSTSEMRESSKPSIFQYIEALESYCTHVEQMNRELKNKLDYQTHDNTSHITDVLIMSDHVNKATVHKDKGDLILLKSCNMAIDKSGFVYLLLENGDIDVGVTRLHIRECEREVLKQADELDRKEIEKIISLLDLEAKKWKDDL